MHVTLSGFNYLQPVNFLYEHDDDLVFNQDTFQTQQGLTLNLVNALSAAKDETILNYSNIFLTNRYHENDIISMPLYVDNTINFSTYLGLSSLSGFNNNTLYVELSSGVTQLSSIITFTKSLSNPLVTNFIFSDINGLQCKVYTFDQNYAKYLTFNPVTSSLYFTTSTPYITSNRYDIFEYSLDDNGFLKLFFRKDDRFALIRRESNTLSAVDAALSTTSSLSTDIFSTNYGGLNEIKFKNDFIYYNKNRIKDFGVDLNRTIEDVKQNYIFYYNYQSEVNFLTGSNNAVVDFYKAKNVLSNEYFVNDKLPFGNDDVIQREYTTILSKQNSELYNGNFQLNYNYYTKEYTLIPDTTTRFTLPETLFPYSVINIENTNLTNLGSFGGLTPVFSDKVIKDLNFNTNTVFYNEANGIYLYTWLYTDSAQLTSYWLDRYYYPKRVSLNIAFSGIANQAYNYTSGLSTFLASEYPIDDYSYYDIRSSLTFEPSASYRYSRIGSNYINKVVDYIPKTVSAVPVFDVYNIPQGTETNLSYSGNSYGGFKLTPDTDNSFAISFNLDCESLAKVKSNLLVGNNFDEGVSLYKGGLNNIYTPGYMINTLSGANFIDVNGNSTFTVNASSFVGAPVQIIDIINTGFDHLLKVFYLNLSNKKPGFLDFSIYGKVFNKYEFDSLANTFNDGNRLNTFDKLYYGQNEVWFLVKPTTAASKVYKFDYLENTYLGSSDIIPTNKNGYNSIVTYNNEISTLSGYAGDILDTSVGVSKLSGYVYFKNLSSGFEGPVLYTESNNIFDLAVLKNRFYILANGYAISYDKYKTKYNTYFTNSSAVSGIKISFINNNFDTKLLCYTANKYGKILVDQFNLESAELEQTYVTDIDINPIYFNEYLYAKKASYNIIEATGFVNSQFVSGGKVNVFTQTTAITGGTYPTGTNVGLITSIPVNATIDLSSQNSGAQSSITTTVKLSGNGIIPNDLVIDAYENSSLIATVTATGNDKQLSLSYTNIIPNLVYSFVCTRQKNSTANIIMTSEISNGAFNAGSFTNVIAGGSYVNPRSLGFNNTLKAYNTISLTEKYGYVTSVSAISLNLFYDELPGPAYSSYETTTINGTSGAALTGFYQLPFNPHLDVVVNPKINEFKPTTISFNCSTDPGVGTQSLSGVSFQTPTNINVIDKVNKYSEGDMVVRLDLFSGNNYKNRQTEIVPFNVTNTSQVVLSFDPNNGLLDIYNNAELIKTVSLSANTFYTSYFLNNNFGVGVPYINNKAAPSIGSNFNSFPTNYSLNNFVVYDKPLTPDEVKFNYLKNQKIDPINFDITQGTRSETDTATSFNKLVIPGRKNNNLKIYIKNAYLNDAGKAQLTSQIIDKLKNILPLNTSEINFEFINYGE